MRARTILCLILTSACHATALYVPEETSGPVDLGRPRDLADPPPPPPDLVELPDPGGRCGPATRAVSAPCGAGTPCVVQVDEFVHVGIDNDSDPDLILDGGAPLFFIGQVEGGGYGQLARRGPSGWVVAPTEYGFTGALARSATAVARLDYNESHGAGYHVESGTGWSSETVPAKVQGTSGGLAIDDDGCAYAAFSALGGYTRIGRRDDAWHFVKPFGADELFEPRVRLTLDGAPQVEGWRAVSGGWALTWVALPGAPELVGSPVGANLHGGRHRFAISGVSPHVLWSSPEGIRYSTRSSTWTTTVITPPDLAAVNECQSMQPTHTGQTCQEHSITYAPIDVLADGATAVRLLWSRIDATTNYAASCPPMPPRAGRGPDQDPASSPDLGVPPPPQCYWMTKLTSQRDLFIAAPDEIATAQPIAHAGLDSGSAALADDGSIHVVGYDSYDVRYLRLGK